IELITSGDGATNLDRDRATEFYENAAGHILELQPIVAHFGRAPFYIRGNVYGPLANGTWTRSGNTITVIQEHSNTYWIEPRELQWTVQGDSVVTGEFGTFTRLSRSRARAFERTLPWMRYTLIQ
ncbi:MAG: hypothetical protein FWG66_08710, partial [Spirochaetes bacterium]|nr:hypothetical protein [Spirochaetota bacterium]